MIRLLFPALVAAAIFAAPAEAFDRPESSRQLAGVQTASDRMPFPALMNSLFGRDRQRAVPEPHFRRPARVGAPTPRVVRQPPPSGYYRAPRAQQVRATPQHAPRPAHRIDPQFERQVVSYFGSEKPGTIVVDTAEKFLYLVKDDGTALRYGVGVGREGFSWKGTETVTRKAEWPSWRPPEEMKKRQPGLPDYMPGGPNNPLGARALYLGSTLYRIHGSNEPWSIGREVSSGCIRMTNDDVIDLYERVSVGATVIVR